MALVCSVRSLLVTSRLTPAARLSGTSIKGLTLSVRRFRRNVVSVAVLPTLTLCMIQADRNAESS